MIVFLEKMIECRVAAFLVNNFMASGVKHVIKLAEFYKSRSKYVRMRLT